MTGEPRDDELAERLERERPALRTTRRQELLRRLSSLPSMPARPARLWLLVLAFGLSGLVLLVLAATQI